MNISKEEWEAMSDDQKRDYMNSIRESLQEVLPMMLQTTNHITEWLCRDLNPFEDISVADGIFYRLELMFGMRVADID